MGLGGENRDSGKIARSFLVFLKIRAVRVRT